MEETNYKRNITSSSEAEKAPGGISTVAQSLGSGIPTACGEFYIEDNKSDRRVRHYESHKSYYVN